MGNLINQEIIFELSDINKTLVCRDNKENIWFINNKVFYVLGHQESINGNINYNVDKTLGEKIKKYRESKGIIQSNFANMLGIERSFLCNYEKGSRIPGNELLNKLLDMLDIKFNYIVDTSAIGKFENCNELNKEIALRLKTYRKGWELSEKKLANKIGITEKTITEYENGSVIPSRKTLLKYSDVLNMPIGDLIYRGGKSCIKKIICID